MTTKSLFYSLTCAMALAVPVAHADDEGVDCAKYPRKDLLEDVRNLVRIQRTGPCSKINTKTIKLEGELTQQKCEAEDDSCNGKDFTQGFSGKNIMGTVSVEWNHQRAGFEEWCQVSLTDCRSGP